MFTINYRSFYIHGYTTSNNCYVQFSNGDNLGNYKSMYGAKLAIGRYIAKAFYKRNMPDCYKYVRP